MKDSEKLQRSSVTPVMVNTVRETTLLPKDTWTFWIYSENKMLLEKLIYTHEKSVPNHEHPTLLSQICMNSDDCPCTKIHQSAEHNM